MAMQAYFYRQSIPNKKGARILNDPCPWRWTRLILLSNFSCD